VRRRTRRLLWAALGGVTLLAVLAIGVFPTRQYLDQRAAAADRGAVLSSLKAQNDSLQQRIDALGTPAEVERIARAEYGLAYPGEETYAVLPTPEPVDRVPAVWPFDR